MSPLPRRVLVAEDQPLLRWALGRVLAPLGAEIVFAPTYRALSDQLAGGEFAVVVVASPLEGHSVTGLLHGIDRSCAHTSVIVLCDGDECGALAFEIPRATVFHKPFSLDPLVAVVAAALRGTRETVGVTPLDVA
jgi:DNA-binding NtrC family response regulator